MTSGLESNEVSPQRTLDELLSSRLPWFTAVELILLNEAYAFNFSSKGL
jgi:hypothetical protein